MLDICLFTLKLQVEDEVVVVVLLGPGEAVVVEEGEEEDPMEKIKYRYVKEFDFCYSTFLCYCNNVIHCNECSQYFKIFLNF